MVRFSDLNIPKPPVRNFTGDKVMIFDILNREIVVKAFKIEDSTKKAGEKCLHLQIVIGNTNHVLFSGSKNLMFRIQQIRPDNFPFTTTIVKDNKTLDFT